MSRDAEELLHLEAVNFTYRALPVLQDINWTWRVGEQWACLGPNGAGKTTLAALISRQITQASGVMQRGPRLARGACSYVCFEQQKALCDRDQRLDDSEFRGDARDPGTTVATSLGGIGDPTTRSRAEQFGIDHILDRGLRFISTGEMRKTLLLRAILQQPEVIILDSPLDGLDQNSQEKMRSILDSLLAGSHHLLLLMRSLEAIPDGITHLLVLDQGRVAAAGSRQEVLGMPTVQSLMHPPSRKPGTLPAPAPRPYRLSPDVPLLALREVSVRYGDTLVLDRVNWIFKPGQHCHIAGPNGCGKTTLLSLVTGDNHKAYGQAITLFGQPRGSGESVWDIKQKFGQVDTRLHLNHVRGMRATEVVVSGFFDTVGLYDDWGGKQLETARAWMQALGLSDLDKRPFDTLSFGLQRMVLLARAMVKSPAILILDEPCLGLDDYHTRTILAAIDQIAEHSDTQVLYVSHSLGQTPQCINQWLEFIPGQRGFEVVNRESG